MIDPTFDMWLNSNGSFGCTCGHELRPSSAAELQAWAKHHIVTGDHERQMKRNRRDYGECRGCNFPMRPRDEGFVGCTNHGVQGQQRCPLYERTLPTKVQQDADLPEHLGVAKSEPGSGSESDTWVSHNIKKFAPEAETCATCNQKIGMEGTSIRFYHSKGQYYHDGCLPCETEPGCENPAEHRHPATDQGCCGFEDHCPSRKTNQERSATMPYVGEMVGRSNRGEKVVYDPAAPSGISKAVEYNLARTKRPDESWEQYHKAPDCMQVPNLHDWVPKHGIAWMSPDEYLGTVTNEINKRATERGHPPITQLQLEDVAGSTKNREPLKQHMLAGKPLDPLWIEWHEDGRYLGQEGRNRAMVARELGIQKVPVVLIRPKPDDPGVRKAAPCKTCGLDNQPVDVNGYCPRCDPTSEDEKDAMFKANPLKLPPCSYCDNPTWKVLPGRGMECSKCGRFKSDLFFEGGPQQRNTEDFE